MSNWEEIKKVVAAAQDGDFEQWDQFTWAIDNAWPRIQRFIDAALAHYDLSPHDEFEEVEKVVEEFWQARKELLDEPAKDVRDLQKRVEAMEKVAEFYERKDNK